MKDHLSPEGKPAPPRPRRPEALISFTIQSGPMSISSLVLYQSPRFIAPFKNGSCFPYRLVKIRSSSFSPPCARSRRCPRRSGARPRPAPRYEPTAARRRRRRSGTRRRPAIVTACRPDGKDTSLCRFSCAPPGPSRVSASPAKPGDFSGAKDQRRRDATRCTPSVVFSGDEAPPSAADVASATETPRRSVTTACAATMASLPSAAVRNETDAGVGPKAKRGGGRSGRP